MMRSQQKLTPPPPVPPRPSKTIIAEALAKSRRISPIRALYATQPLSVEDLHKEPHYGSTKPVVPVRAAPPPPTNKPRLGVPPQVVKSYSSAMVCNPKLKNLEESNRVVRSVSDCGDDISNNKSRTVVYQSSNIKTSKIEVKIARKPSVKNSGLKRVESTKNERNKEISDDKPIDIKPEENQENWHSVKIDTAISNGKQDETKNDIVPEAPKTENIVTEVTNDDDQTSETLSDTIVQSSDKTMIIVTNKTDDANNNIFQPNESKDDNNSDSSNEKGSKDSTAERKKVQFDDKINHEILIAELQCMREEQERLLKRQRKPPVDIYDCDNESVNSDRSSQSRIQHSDWVEVANNGEEVRLSSCQIFIDEDDPKTEFICRKPTMSSLHGLPPLPKSLSGFNLDNNARIDRELNRGGYRVPASPGPQTPSRAGSSRGPTPPTPTASPGLVVYPPHPRLNGTADLPRGRKVTTLDTQLAILRREMYGLRQLDLSLLSQLYSLNESIQDFRAMLQEQEDSALSPHSPSPSPSSGDDADEFFSPAPIRYKPAPPLRRTSNSSSANSSEYGTV